MSVQLMATSPDDHTHGASPMCSPTRCHTCKKTTWSGCGSHVQQVMRSVPKQQRCTCSADERDTRGAIARFLGNL